MSAGNSGFSKTVWIQKLDFPPKKLHFRQQKLDFWNNLSSIWLFWHQEIAMNHKISQKELISDQKQQKLDSSMKNTWFVMPKTRFEMQKNLDFESKKLDFKGQKLNFPAFYSSGFKCICAEKKSLIRVKSQKAKVR